MKISKTFTVVFFSIFASFAYAEQVECNLYGTRSGQSVNIDLSKVTCDFSDSSEEDTQTPKPFIPPQTQSLAQARAIMRNNSIRQFYWPNAVLVETYVVEKGQSIASVLGSNTEAQKAMIDMGIGYSSNQNYSMIPDRTIPPGFTFYKFTDGRNFFYQKGAE